MKKLLFTLMIFISLAMQAQTLTYQVTPNQGGTITVDWQLSYDKPPRYFSVAIFYGKQVNIAPDITVSPIASWDSEINFYPPPTSGSMTITPPAKVKGPWFFVIGHAAQFIGPEIDQYESTGPIVSTDFKLLK